MLSATMMRAMIREMSWKTSVGSYGLRVVATSCKAAR